MFLRYDFCFPAFRRRSWEEEPGGALEGRVYVRRLGYTVNVRKVNWKGCGNAATARGGLDTACKHSSVI